MNEWQKASMDNLYYNPEYTPDVGDDCLVQIGSGLIAVKYDDDGELVVWRGHEVGPDHYDLQSPEVSGKATLHRFADTGVLVGDWLEDGERGMWRIKLARWRGIPT